jgi:hypothetical protein
MKIIKIIAFIINVWKAINWFSSYKILDAEEKCLQTEHTAHILLTKLQNSLATSQKNGTDIYCRNNNKPHKETVLFVGIIVQTCI